MKKLLFFFATASIIQIANAQNSFYKHALVASVGFGGDGYHITETYSVNGYPNIPARTVTGSAACFSYPILAEYGVGKWLGLGLEGKVDNYIIKKDTTNNYQPTARGFEFGAIVNFHIVRSQHIDFLAGLDLGGSKFTYTADHYNDQVYGTGSWGDIHLALRYYFGKLGIHADMAFPTMNYTLTGNNANWSLGQNILASWKASGFAFHLGLQYRFINESAN